MVNYNTNYYRRNKKQKFKVHSCKYCEFETTGPKSSLNADPQGTSGALDMVIQ